jgi:hypothetical protein
MVVDIPNCRYRFLMVSKSALSSTWQGKKKQSSEKCTETGAENPRHLYQHNNEEDHTIHTLRTWYQSGSLRVWGRAQWQERQVAA